MPDLFSVPFERLELSDLQGFLDGAEPEPLLWEAKGGRPNAHEIRKQCGGFANSERGGYLFLGVSEGPDRWRLPGMEFDDGEPHRYVSSCLLEGVRPMPNYDVRSFEVAPRTHVAIVQVEPLNAGPCIVRGTVYERVAGATVPVKDPVRLAALFARGRQAHDRAHQGGQQSIDAVLNRFTRLDQEAEASDDEQQTLIVVLAVAPVTADKALSSRLFRDSMRTRMHEVAESLLAGSSVPFGNRCWTEVQQDRRLAIAVSPHGSEQTWVVAASWDGSVAIGVRSYSGVGSPKYVVDEFVRPAYRAAAALAGELVGDSFGYIDIRVGDTEDRRWANAVGVVRGPQDLREGALDLEGVYREFSRAVGNEAPEPETRA